ncbi:MAG: beta-lactamase family protein [bacterium]|nr:beta-lactamase family protein [bacterium]
MTERMRHHKVPGVSIAVIKDFKVDWTKGYGFSDIAARGPVTADTLFQAASISKPVAAMAALKLVSEGKLALHENVNKRLKSWKLPDNKFTGQQEVTLAHLLSHSGGVTVHGFRGYSSLDKVPTLLQLLDGKTPANSAAIRVDLTPGTQTRYSGGGFCIVQQLLIDTVKQPFPVIMENTVLKPMGMTHSTYRQPLPPEKAKFAASGHLSSGLPLTGKWHTYPEMAAAGLWTTSGDLARFAAGIQQTLQNKSAKVLSRQAAEEMLTPFASNSVGLGIMLTRKGDAVYFQHGGSNEGFRCYLIGHTKKGYGAVVMTNSDNGGSLYPEILRGIANIYGWENWLPEPYEIVNIDPAKLKPLAGKYAVDSDHLLSVNETNGQLYAQVTSSGKGKLFPVSESKFIRKDQSVVYQFVKDDKTGKVLRVEAERNGQTRSYSRKGDDYTVPLELLLTGQIPKALEGYRQLKTQNPSNPMIGGMRLLLLTEELIGKGRLEGALALLHLTAELHPEFIKKMYTTLNNEIRLLLRNPSIPEPIKQKIKDSYNSMLKKLRLKPLE